MAVRGFSAGCTIRLQDCCRGLPSLPYQRFSVAGSKCAPQVATLDKVVTTVNKVSATKFQTLEDMLTSAMETIKMAPMLCTPAHGNASARTFCSLLPRQCGSW